MRDIIEQVIKKNLPESMETCTCEEDIGYHTKECNFLPFGFNDCLSQINTSLIADEVLKVVAEKIEKEMPNFLHKYGTFLVLHYDEVEPLERRAKKNELTQEFLNLLTNSSTLEGEQSEHLSTNKENK